jgi:ABC-type multidrug transport system fused ATPase/permease subunit
VIGATFLAVALLNQGTLVVEQYLAGNVAWRATNRLRADLTLHCLTLDLSYHGAHPPGELLERVDGDVAKLSEFFSQFLVRLVGNVLLLLGILLLSFGIEWRVGLALATFALSALAVLGSLRQFGARAWEAQSRASAGLFGFLEEYLSGTEDLRANGATAFALRRLAEQQRTQLRTTQRAVLRGYAPYSATTILLSVGTAIGLLLGAYLYHIGTLTIGSVYLIFAYTELLRRPLEEIGRQVQQLQQASASVARIGELLAVQSRISDGPGRDLPSGALAIAFEGVTFGYDDQGMGDKRSAEGSCGWDSRSPTPTPHPLSPSSLKRLVPA